MLDLSFPYRVLVLVAVLATISGIERCLRKGKAVRWKYSLFALGSGAMGAAYGAAHDAVTVRIAPEYFSILKGLGPEDLQWRASSLGAQAGFSLGVIGAAVLACLGERRRAIGESPDLRALVRAYLGVAGASAGFAVAGGLLAYWVLRPQWVSALAPGFSPQRGRCVLTVWTTHLCTYLGAGVGLAASCRAVASRRLKRPHTDPSPPGRALE